MRRHCREVGQQHVEVRREGVDALRERFDVRDQRRQQRHEHLQPVRPQQRGAVREQVARVRRECLSVRHESCAVLPQRRAVVPADGMPVRRQRTHHAAPSAETLATARHRLERQCHEQEQQHNNDTPQGCRDCRERPVEHQQHRCSGCSYRSTHQQPCPPWNRVVVGGGPEPVHSTYSVSLCERAPENESESESARAREREREREREESHLCAVLVGLSLFQQGHRQVTMPNSTLPLWPVACRRLLVGR